MENLKYLEWNNIISAHFFNLSNAGKDIYLYLTKRDIISLGRPYFMDKTEQDIWADYITSIKRGIPGSNGNVIAKAKFAYSKNSLLEKRRQDGSPLEINGVPIIFPPYISYLVFIVLPLIESVDGNCQRANNYYGRLNSFLQSLGINENIGTNDFSTNQINDLWEDLKQWANIKNRGDLGLFNVVPFTRKGFKGERGKLTIVFFDKILELKPTFFVMENVTGLTKRKETKEFLQMLLKRIEKEYYVDHEKLNSLDFGVPQHRERVFFIGIRKEFLNKKNIEKNPFGKWFPFPVNEKYQNALTKYNWGKQVKFGVTLIAPKDIPIELCVESCLVPQGQIDLIANANEFFNLHVSKEKLQAINEGETNRPSFKRLHRFRYSPTTCYGNNEVHLHPYMHRRLSVREALRIQGVPDTYILPDKLPISKKFKMIGNGVPVPLAEAVADAVITFIRKIYWI